MQKKYRLILAALVPALFLMSNQAFASKGNEKVEAKQNDNCNDGVLIEKSNAQTAQFAQIPLNARVLAVVAESAKVVIKRVADGTTITVASNCPRDWAVQGSLIRQAGFSDQRKGSSLLADDLGSRAIAGGRVYLFPPGGMKGLKLGSDGVFVNGQLVEPLKGSDIPCNCTGEDYLEISVPQGFVGELKIGATGKSKISLDTWKDGGVECVLLGNSSFTAGKLDSVAKAAFDNKGNGAILVSEVDTKVFVANITGQGNGSIKVAKGRADMSNATVEGNGIIELSGKFLKLQKLVNGTGKIEVKEPPH